MIAAIFGARFFTSLSVDWLSAVSAFGSAASLTALKVFDGEHLGHRSFCFRAADFAERKQKLELYVGAFVLRESEDFLRENRVLFRQRLGEADGRRADFRICIGESGERGRGIHFLQSIER